MDANYVAGLHALLVQSTQSNTLQLKAATAQLNKEYYKNPACIPGLAQILASSPEESIRQLAAVELRKRISNKSGELWIQVSQGERDQIKGKLPELTIAEPSKLVRHSSARVIAAIAEIELPNGQWPSLLSTMHQCATSAVVAQREIGIFVIFAVLEAIVEGFQEHLQQLFKLFAQLLQDPESAEVRVTTVRALGVVAQYIEADEKASVKAFQELLPGMIAVVGSCLENGDEVGSRHLFDVFETLLILEVPLLSKHIPDLVQFFLACGANQRYESDLRIMALNALSWTVKYKKSKIQASGLAPAILEGLMPITTEPEPEDVDDDAPCRSALRIIDTLATALPPTQVFPPLRQLTHAFMASPDPARRRGAMLALGVAVEGCSEFMNPHLDSQVWPLVDAALGDADPGVRRAACTTVGCLCEWLEDACVARHTQLVPQLMNLASAGAPTQREACTALDALLEVLPPDVISGYLQPLLTALTGLLDAPDTPTKVKAVVVGAIGSAAHAAKAQFLDYFPAIMGRLQPFLLLRGEGEETELRGIAMDAAGTFADAVGKEAFRPYFMDLMGQAFDGIEVADSARLRECSFLFFGVMGRVFEEEFAPSLERVVDALLKSLQQEESGSETLLSDKEAAELFATGAAGDDKEQPKASTSTSIEVEVDDDDDIDTDKLLEVNSAIAVEKEIAADTIGTLFAATGRHFLPYVEKCTLELVSLLPHYYEGIRKGATESLLEIVRTFYKLSEPADWVPGLNAGGVELHQNVKDLIGHALMPLLDMYESEDDKTVVGALCVGVAETINVVGPKFLDGHLENISSIAIQILEQKALCQQDPDQDEDDEPLEDQAEYDSVLISSADDLVSALANVLGADFTQAFQTFFPLISKFYKKSRSLSDRSSAIGCLAEIISGMKDAITSSTQPLLELFYQALSDEDAEVQSNAAFAAGLLIENSTVDLSPQYLHLLQALRPFFDVAPDAPTARNTQRDNAAGAVARMIVRNTSAVPLDQVLPPLMGALPLTHDFLENRPVFKCIFHLFRTNPSVLTPYMDRLLPVFAHVLDPSAAKGEDQLGNETRAELLNLVTALAAENPAKVQAAGLGPYVQGA